MRKLILSVLVLLLVAFGGLLWWVTRTVGDHMITSQASSVKLLDDMDIVCPPEAAKIGRPQGKAGWMVFCERDGELHGPWLTAENGRLEIRGQYRNGERDGVWEWYNDDGAVEKKLTYDDREDGAPDASRRDDRTTTASPGSGAAPD